MNNLWQTIRALPKVASAFLIVSLILFSGCGYKPYVGSKFDTTDWPKYVSGKTIKFSMDAADFDIKITESQEEGVYNLEGTMDGSNGSLKSIGFLVVSECHFSVILAKDGVVVDNVTFSPQGTDILHKLPFSRKFKTVPFDSMTITYQIYVRG